MLLKSWPRQYKKSCKLKEMEGQGEFLLGGAEQEGRGKRMTGPAIGPRQIGSLLPSTHFVHRSENIKTR